ncbi:DUF4387 domain-containing protein [Paenibacillus sp. FSL W8-1187]|uniref:DUF4387 domain-containing protein n=1 Tax=Paenibacillus pasadenensis TaxID=217090 RepID=A0A2N5N8D2_9BACL|nr:DUF4387 domain-containing protein [Paenibacillus pasadenensis]PLT46583.1 hypothetical protein B8V81_0807 [Paenibacillus pasadenensis]
MTKLGDLAKVLRSKNSGPFEITLDVLFDSRESYEQVKGSGSVTPRTVSEAYGISEERIRHFVFFDPALGFKVTMSREVSSGSAGDRDVYGAQQHAPLMRLEIDCDREV